MTAKDHHWACDWHVDQYDSECCCGVTGPRSLHMDRYGQLVPVKVYDVALSDEECIEISKIKED